MSKELTESLRLFTAAVTAAVKRLEQNQKEILDRLEELREPAPSRETYSPTEAAEILGKRPYTVREWCRLRRIKAKKRACGRGGAAAWEITADEIERIRNHGLLALPKRY